MGTIDLFLNELRNRIDSNEKPINNYETKRNNLIEIKNILYAHEIINNEVLYTDLLNFSNDEIKRVLLIIDNDKANMYYRAFLVYKPLIDSYNAIKEKFGSNFEAPQYLEAVKWLSDLAKKINLFLNEDSSDSEDYINEIKSKNSLYKKYYNLFKGVDLVSPVNNLSEFNNLLDNMNLTDLEKGKIKKEIGISNLKLLYKNYNKLDNEEFNKYRVIAKNKRNKYEKLYDVLKNKDISFNSIEEHLNELKNELNSTLYDIRQALCAIFIEREFKAFANNEIDYDVLIENLEEILNFSRIEDESSDIENFDINSKASSNLDNETIKLKERRSSSNENNDLVHNNSEEKTSNDENELIKEVKSILKLEQPLIDSIDEEKFSLYLAQSVNDDENEDSIKYKIVSILIAMHSEVQKYKNVKKLKNAKNMALSNIRDYVDAYKSLKEKLNK